jgi:hypothetical protein
VDYRLGDLVRYGDILAEGIDALAGDDPLARARLTSDLGWSLHRRGHGDEARALYEEARPVFEQGGTTATAPLIRCLDRLALVTSWDDPAAAVTVADEALATSRAAGDDRNEAVVLLHRGEILSRCDRHDEAAAQPGRRTRPAPPDRQPPPHRGGSASSGRSARCAGSR